MQEIFDDQTRGWVLMPRGTKYCPGDRDSRLRPRLQQGFEVQPGIQHQELVGIEEGQPLEFGLEQVDGVGIGVGLKRPPAARPVDHPHVPPGSERARDGGGAVGGAVVEQKNGVEPNNELPGEPLSDVVFLVFDNRDTADFAHVHSG